MNALLRRTLVPLLIVALPIAAMMAYILYSKHKPPPATVENQPASIRFGIESWPFFRGDPGLTGLAVGNLPSTLSLAWTFETEEAVKSAPVVAENTVYISSMDGRLYAVDLQDGTERWRLETDAGFEASGLYHDGRVYIGNADGILYAVDGSSGETVWRREIVGKVTGTANIAVHPDTGKPVVLFGSYDNHLYCLDSQTGQIVFEYEAGYYINGSIAVSDGAAVFGSCDANLYRVPIGDPNGVQTLDAGAYVAAATPVKDGIVYAGSLEGRFLAANIQTQTILWDFEETDAGFYSSPAVNETVVIVGCRDQHVYCFDRMTGTIQWTYESQENFDSSPLICGDTVAVGCDDGRLYLLDIQTGAEIFSYTLGSPIVSAAAIAQNHLLIGCDNGTMYAFVEKR